jgi:hypothetical protein
VENGGGVVMRKVLIACVLALAFLTAGCAELLLVGAGAAGGYYYTKGQQSGKGEKSEKSEKSGTTSSEAPTKKSD